MFEYISKYFVSKIIPAITTVLSISLFTKYLSPEEYGLYSLSLSISVGLSLIFFQWLNVSVGRYIPAIKDEQDKKKMITTILVSFVVISIFLLIANLGLSYISDYSFFVNYVGVLAITIAWFELNQKLNNSLFDPKSYTISLGAKNILAVLLGGVGLYLGYDGRAIIVTLVLSQIISVMNNYKIWKNTNVQYLDLNLLKRILRYGLPLTLTFLMIFIINSSGKFILNELMGEIYVGYLSVTYDLAQLLLITICGILNLATYPIVIDAFSKSKELANKKLQDVFLIVIGVTIPVALGLISVRSEVTYLFIDMQYYEYVIQLLPIILGALFLSALKSAYFDYAFHLSEKTGMQSLAVIISALTCIILNYVLIPMFGIIGAAYASLFSYATYLVGCIFIGSLVYKLPPIKINDTCSIVVSALIMFYIVSGIVVDSKIISLLLKVGVGVFVYSSLLVFFNVMGVKEYIFKKYIVNIK